MGEKRDQSLGLSGAALLAWAGVGLLGRTGAGDPSPWAWAGVGLPGRRADGVFPVTPSTGENRSMH